MGEAYDRAGHFLGSVEAETKREVLDKLLAAHGDAAHEIRIRTLGQVSPSNSVPDGASIEMPRWKCHKEVHALKIRSVTDPTPPGNESDGSRLLHFDDVGYGAHRVPHDYVRKHNPQAGGYYVIYDDGYASWSPAKAFEDGYTRVGVSPLRQEPEA